MRGARTRGWYYFPYDNPTHEKAISTSNKNDQWRRLMVYGYNDKSNEINHDIVEDSWIGDSVHGMCNKDSDKVNYMSNVQRLTEQESR